MPGHRQTPPGSRHGGVSHWPTPHTPNVPNVTQPVIKPERLKMDQFERIMIGKQISFELEDKRLKHPPRRVKAKVKASESGMIFCKDLDHPEVVYTLKYDPEFVTLEA